MDNNWLDEYDICVKDSVGDIELRPGAVRIQNIARAIWKDELIKMYDYGDKNGLTPAYRASIEGQSKLSSSNIRGHTASPFGDSLITYTTADSRPRSYGYHTEYAENSFENIAFTFQDPDILEYSKLLRRKRIQDICFALNENTDRFPNKLWNPYLTEIERKIWMDPIEENSFLPDKFPDRLVSTVSSTPEGTATYKGASFSCFRGPIKTRATTVITGCNAPELGDMQSKSNRDILIGDPLAVSRSTKTEVFSNSWSPYLTEYERKIWMTDFSAVTQIRDEFVGNHRSPESAYSSNDICSYQIPTMKKENEEENIK